MDIQVDLHRKNGIPLIAVSGSVTLENRTELIEVFDRVLAGKDRALGLHLGKVLHISSSGVGSILAMKGELKQRGGDLVLIEISPACQAVLSLLSLSEFFRRFEDEASALKWLKRIQG